MTKQYKELGSDCRIKVEVHRWLQSSSLNSKTTTCDDGYQLWQLVDWEGFGIGSLSYSHYGFILRVTVTAELTQLQFL